MLIIEELNIDHFDTTYTFYLNEMFYGCSSLKELNLNNLIIKDYFDTRSMFARCSYELQIKVKNHFKDIKDYAFY